MNPNVVNNLKEAADDQELVDNEEDFMRIINEVRKGYDFNGYRWISINNAILVYRINPTDRIVTIESCYSALSGEVAEIFYNIMPEEE